jgi:hypothetical protein
MAQKRPKTASINIVEKQSNYEPTGDAKQTKDALPRSEWQRISHITPCYKCCARLGSEKKTPPYSAVNTHNQRLKKAPLNSRRKLWREKGYSKAGTKSQIPIY